MRAAVYSVSPLGWATCKWLKVFWPGCLLTPINGLTLRDLPPPELVGDEWVRVRTLMGGICGSDLAVLAQRHPPDSLLQAYSSMPMVLGHENVGIVERVGQAVEKSWLGKRVCVEPTLSCRARGIDPPCPRCAEGQFGACENFAADKQGRWALPPGTSIGYNSRTGGSWGEQFVAHQSQLVAVPEDFSDELAVLTDPVACALHAVLRADLSDVGRVLVYGGGMLGLAATACLRAAGYAGRTDVLVRYDYQAELARRMGADEALRLPRRPTRRFEEIAERTGGSVQRARFSNLMLSGGYDAVFDCVGSSRSLAESLKWTRSRGQVLLVGAGVVAADATPIWFKELRVLGAWGRQVEQFDGRRADTYTLVHELMAAGKLEVAELLTHTFPLVEYKEALTVAMHKAGHRAVKVAFDYRAAATVGKTR